jgi:BirA family biotin operon repressor/biotin-[acetyl-CoA-carboxylase] ligase
MDYLKIYNILDSTNKEAHRLLAQGPVLNGLALIAHHQTEGRGQMGRSWISEPGSHLAMTLIYYPTGLNPANLPILGMKISLGIVHALNHIDPSISPSIKWPNDIYAEGKKLCGILIENALSGSSVQHCVIGIGMNINENHFPAEIPNAISMRMLTGTSHDIPAIALRIREQVLSILDNAPPQWKNDYDGCIFGKGSRFRFISNADSFEAEVMGVSLRGHLELKMDDGEIKSFASHEVKWVVG